MKINRISNTIKTTALAGLLATSPVAKAQEFLRFGEKTIGTDTVELFKGQRAALSVIDIDGNYNTFERVALSTKSQKPSKHQNLKGKEGYVENRATQYIDTLVKVFTRIEDQSEEYAKYYVAGPQIRRNALFEKENDKLVSVFIDSRYKDIDGVYMVPHKRMEIPKNVFEALKDFLKLTPVKEEHVVKSLDEIPIRW
jgi:hypothetical protein